MTIGVHCYVSMMSLCGNQVNQHTACQRLKGRKLCSWIERDSAMYTDQYVHWMQSVKKEKCENVFEPISISRIPRESKLPLSIVYAFTFSLYFPHIRPQIESWRVFLYYQLACGYHAHRAVWQFWDKKRSDFIVSFCFLSIFHQHPCTLCQSQCSFLCVLLL